MIRLRYENGSFGGGGGSPGLSGGSYVVVATEKYEGKYASGLTIIGRGQDLAVAITGVGKGAQSTVQTFSGNPLGTGAGFGEVVTEGIREVN